MERVPWVLYRHATVDVGPVNTTYTYEIGYLSGLLITELAGMRVQSMPRTSLATLIPLYWSFHFNRFPQFKDTIVCPTNVTLFLCTFNEIGLLLLTRSWCYIYLQVSGGWNILWNLRLKFKLKSTNQYHVLNSRLQDTVLAWTSNYDGCRLNKYWWWNDTFITMCDVAWRKSKASMIQCCEENYLHYEQISRERSLKF